jgi:hypothetical protein
MKLLSQKVDFGEGAEGDSSSFVMKDTFASASHACLSKYLCLDLEIILVISFLGSPSGASIGKFSF